MGEKYSKPDGFAVFVGLGLVACGIGMLLQGYDAYKTGKIIPPNGKHGWMSGPEFMIAGSMSLLLGLGLLMNELVKAYRRRLK